MLEVQQALIEAQSLLLAMQDRILAEGGELTPHADEYLVSQTGAVEVVMQNVRKLLKKIKV